MPKPTAYLVCATQRSGSTLLVESLAATGVAGRPQEFFQYYPSSSRSPQPREWFAGVTNPRILGLLDDTEPGSVDSRTESQWRSDVWSAGSTPNGVWGGKLMWNQTSVVVTRTRTGSGSLRTAIRSLFDGADPVYVHVFRPDVVPQAVSMWRAVQTQVWRDAPDADPARDEGAEYLAEGIAHLAGILLEQERSWRSWFASEGIEPLEVDFTELVRDPRKTTGRVLEALGQDPDLAPAPPLRRQSNARSREWVRRYREDAAANGYPA
ncbi:Stf0 family sulfotransferase [Tsukamurella sp. 8F]|uniref:trehalose 2-sulfotransferase n=1 Tax=unclassified Tsukamurella TaxID=2633480 RepID=UPI0023B8AF57|nr:MULTISPECIES: Stf0 family sulfotransferase [unclassified Tsukamurella]MDF0528400.1 Stf0 family sulfotransferase [Tsukamurella sp. 8J]MDF0586225.1 Stf0 family sulfotransferase [Tsukamurella sp. 8F]